MEDIINDFREDEIQALIALVELSDPVETPNNNSYRFHPKNMREARTYFRRFALDISEALKVLGQRGLVQRTGDQWTLTSEGRGAAAEIRRLRPPIYYWYRDFHSAIEGSAAFAEYSKRVYGRDLGQHGFSDLDQLHRMLELVALDRSSRMLDLGCGSGKIAEYISDLTGAMVTGVDYVPEAIANAMSRTQGKRDRLRFQVGHIDALDLCEVFDVILSIDTIFFGVSLQATVARLKDMLSSNGRLVIFYGGGDLAAALEVNELAYEAYDLSQADYAHKQRKHRVASEMRSAFEREGNLFIWENQMAESIKDAGPYDPAKHSTSRHLYLARRR